MKFNRCLVLDRVLPRGSWFEFCAFKDTLQSVSVYIGLGQKESKEVSEGIQGERERERDLRVGGERMCITCL